MNSRQELQELLETILGSRNVYYQPPESVKMNYPAIRYSKSNINNIHADNGVYSQRYFYDITVISKTPDDRIVSEISCLPTCRFNRHYVADNLYHDVFTIHF